MVYLLSKLLPLALLPLGFSLILLLVGLIGRWRWPVIIAVVLLWGLLLGLVSQTLWRWLEAPWQRTTAAELLPLRRSWCSVAVVTPLQVLPG